jgi:hypothetical protein
MNKLGQFFQDDNDRFSATRLAFLAWIFGALIIWGAGSINDKKMQRVPDSIQVLIGILMTGKVTQKFREERSQNTLPENVTTENAIKSTLDKAGNGVATTSTRQN